MRHRQGAASVARRRPTLGPHARANAIAHLRSAGGAKEHVKALAAGRPAAPAHATKEEAALYVKEKNTYSGEAT